jgi:uncharacterized protein (TIGR02996 family)
MTDRETLLAAVLANPAVDTARLVLADFLRESDDPAERALGQFIWAGVTICRFRDEKVSANPLSRAAQKALSATTAAGFPARWISELGLGPRQLIRGDWHRQRTRDKVTLRLGSVAGVFMRGMLSELCVPQTNWYTVAPVALATWPLSGGTITDIPGLAFRIGRSVWGWWLAVEFSYPRRRVSMAAPGVPAAIASQMFQFEKAGWVYKHDTFPDRAALIAGLASRSAAFVAELREEFADGWPSPLRLR